MLNTRRYDRKTIFFLSQLDEADEMRQPLQQILLGDCLNNIAALRYLGYTENGTLRHYPAESLVKEFHDPAAVQAVLARYTS